MIARTARAARPAPVIDSPPLLPSPPETLLLPSPEVSEQDFGEIVRNALDAVGGTLLFKVRIAAEEDDQHIAAACVGTGTERQFLLLSLPASGGRLKVEAAARSASPLARIAESYAGLLDVFKAAA